MNTVNKAALRLVFLLLMAPVMLVTGVVLLVLWACGALPTRPCYNHWREFKRAP